MIYFDSDYMCGAIPEIMEALNRTNFDYSVGYGLDSYSIEAEQRILELCDLKDGCVKFVIGGTEANSTVIDGLLGRCQGVLASETAHINVHEAGTIEAFGHKILTLPTDNGKISAKDIDRYITDFYNDATWQHMVEPGAVYISFPTELGTLYSKAELEDISAVCRRHAIPLYVDGARLGYGLASTRCDLTLKDLARLADVFSIGGTKQGALFGEAIVVSRRDILPRFLSLIKQHGALLAKGRLLGVQFLTLFDQRRLYAKYSEQAVAFAMAIKRLFTHKGYPLFIDSFTNQQFFVLPNAVIDRLRESVSFELWGPRGAEETPVRFVTSWATTPGDIAALALALENS